MVDSDINTANSKRGGGGDELLRGDRESGIRRELSFSGWCDENGIFHSGQLDNKNDNVDDFDFELRVEQSRSENEVIEKKRLGFSKGKQKMEVGVDIREHHRRNMGNGNSNYVPFDIDNGPKFDSNTGSSHGSYVDDHEASREKVKPVSVADVLKTLFFVLAWYTFSTFLTL